MIVPQILSQPSRGILLSIFAIIAESDEQHDDAWELGTGKNYSINEVARMFNTEVVHLPDVKGNYRETIRINNDAIERLGWQPTDRLEQYIKNLYNGK